MPDGEFTNAGNPDDFFVGYLPTPTRARRVLACTTAIVLLLALILGGAIAASQRDPGSGQWAANDTRTVQGVFRSSPYPFLEVDSAPGERPRPMLIVDQGKIGGRRLTSIADGSRVKVRGQLLQRGTLTLLELADEPKPAEALAGSVSPLAAPRLLGPHVSLIGEIVDPKCYAGAMKPGEGKTHKACAALCLRGGIPPVFISASLPSPRVLTDDNGAALSGESLEKLIALVGEPVALRGNAFERGAVGFLAIDLGSVTRSQ